MSAIIPNITSYPTPNPNPNPLPSHIDPSQYPYPHGIHGSAFDLAGGGAPVAGMISQTTDANPYEHVVGSMSEPTNAVFVTRQPENILPFQCEVCNVSCNTKEVLEKHKQGKRHLKAVKKLTDSSGNVSQMVPPPVSSENLVEELENKKQRLLQNGAAAETLLYCEICNVICNNQDGYKLHMASKKHSAKSIIQLAGGTSVAFDPTSDSSGGSQKKAATFPCEICKIICNSDELLKSHIAGKRHLKKVRELGQIPNLPLPLTAIASEATQPTKPVVDPESNEDNTVNLQRANPESSEDKTVNLTGAKPSNVPLTPIATQDAPSTNPSSEDKTVNLDGAELSNTPATDPLVNPESNEGKTVNIPVANWVCELCGISCNTEEVLKIHLGGKKHQKNLQKSEKLIGPNPALMTEPAEPPKVIGPMQEEGEAVGSKRKGKKGGDDDDVEAKKQRLLQSGTASDAVQMCNLCNVVCNSQKVFISHLAGQKHATMALKQAESQARATGQES